MIPRAMMAPSGQNHLVADKAYGSARIRREIEDEGALPVIPAKTNAKRPILRDAGLYATGVKLSHCFEAKVLPRRNDQILTQENGDNQPKAQNTSPETTA